MAFTLPALPYAYDALEPYIDAQTMTIHHTKHHNAYLTKLNDAIAGTELESKSAEQIIADLKSAGLLLRHETYDHPYPHCWRCDSPLIQRAVSSWFVEVTKFRDRMVELNQQITWQPAHIKDGSFGMVPGRHWHRLDDGRFQCDVCPRFCKLRPGQRGLCFVRQGTADGIALTTYGRAFFVLGEQA